MGGLGGLSVQFSLILNSDANNGYLFFSDGGTRGTKREFS